MLAINIDTNNDDCLYLKFTNNQVIQTITIEDVPTINVDIDINNKVVGLEVNNYSKVKEWAQELLQENGLSLNDDSIVFYIHHGYECIWFDLRDVKDEYTVCKYYLEGESNVEYDLVKNCIQDEVNLYIMATKILDQYK